MARTRHNSDRAFKRQGQGAPHWGQAVKQFQTIYCYWGGNLAPLQRRRGQEFGHSGRRVSLWGRRWRDLHHSVEYSSEFDEEDRQTSDVTRGHDATRHRGDGLGTRDSGEDDALFYSDKKLSGFEGGGRHSSTRVTDEEDSIYYSVEGSSNLDVGREDLKNDARLAIS